MLNKSAWVLKNFSAPSCAALACAITCALSCAMAVSVSAACASGKDLQRTSIPSAPAPASASGKELQRTSTAAASEHLQHSSVAPASDKDLQRTLHIIDQHVQRESNRASSATDIKKVGTEVTAKYEEERINADAQYEKDQVYNRDPLVIRARMLHTPEDMIFPTPATERALAEIEERRQIDVKRARTARNMKLEEANIWGKKRENDLNTAAENLKSQLLNANVPSGAAGKNTYSLKAVGTNLYVRQYGPPETAREVHNAAAKVVPFGTITPVRQAN